MYWSVMEVSTRFRIECKDYCWFDRRSMNLLNVVALL